MFTRDEYLTWQGMDPAGRVSCIIEHFSKSPSVLDSPIRGLSEDQLAEVQRDQPAGIGPAYRRFLEIAGSSAGGLFLGSDVFYPRVLGLWVDAQDLLQENSSEFSLTHDDRVVLMHQGYEFNFLRGAGLDPEVWEYSEMDPDNRPRRVSDHFTDWLYLWAERNF